MYKKHIIFILLLQSFLFSIEITRVETFIKDIKKPYQQSSLIITIENKSSGYIKDTYLQLSDIVRKSKICVGDSYTVDNITLGETGNANFYFNCKYTNRTKLNELITDIRKYEIFAKIVDIDNESLEKQYEKALLDLETSAFDKGEKYIQHLEKNFQNCFTQSIKIVKDKELKETEAKVKINVNYTYVCDNQTDDL